MGSVHETPRTYGHPPSLFCLLSRMPIDIGESWLVKVPSTVRFLSPAVIRSCLPQYPALAAPRQQHHQSHTGTQPDRSLNRKVHTSLLSFGVPGSGPWGKSAAPYRGDPSPVSRLRDSSPVLLPRSLARPAPFQKKHHDPARGDPDGCLNNRVVHTFALLVLVNLGSSSSGTDT